MRRILFVDDEPKVLNAIRRGLRDEFEIETAESGSSAIERIAGGERYCVIVSDFKMPEMNGIQLLQSISELCPDSVRIMLTGFTDQKTAVSAVNRGEVFRFLNKPCSLDDLRASLKSAIRQYELVVAERELLNETLNGSIKLLSEVLGIVRPDVFGRTSRLRQKALEIAELLENVDLWVLDTAVLLSQLGCIAVPDSILRKLREGEQLSREEAREYESHPGTGAELIGKIPRLEKVARVIGDQRSNLANYDHSEQGRLLGEPPVESRILQVVIAYDELLARGWSGRAVVADLKKRGNGFDSSILDALADVQDNSASRKVLRIRAKDLMPGMVIFEDIKTEHGVLLICRGQEVTPTVREHLQKFEKNGALTKPIVVALEEDAEFPVPGCANSCPA